MARFQVHHSADACAIHIKGDKRDPEPTMATIQFPGGHVEVSRASDGSYWVHFGVDHPANTKESRIDYCHEEYRRRIDAGLKKGEAIPAIEHVEHLAFRVYPQHIKPTGD